MIGEETKKEVWRESLRLLGAVLSSLPESAHPIHVQIPEQVLTTFIACLVQVQPYHHVPPLLLLPYIAHTLGPGESNLFCLTNNWGYFMYLLNCFYTFYENGKTKLILTNLIQFFLYP